MAKTINSDLIRGNINTIILKSLYEGDRYGYDIIKEIEEKSHGQYVLKQPTLYSCLKRLENQGFITAYWGEQTNGGRRKYYTLTDMGREVFIQYQDEYEYSRTIIDQLISERDYDLDNVEPAVSPEEPEASLDAEADIEIESTPPQASYDNEVEATEAPLYDESAEKENNIESDTTIGVAHPQQLNDTELSIDSTSIIDELLHENNQGTYTDIAATEPKSKQIRQTEEPQASFDTVYQSDTYVAPYDQNATEQTSNQTEAESYDLLSDFLNYSAMESSAYSKNANQPTPQAQPEFKSYNTDQPTYEAPIEAKSNPHYKSVLAGLVGDFDEPTDTHPAQDKLTKDKLIAESNLSVKERVQVRNFGKLTESIRELGENVKIRTPDTYAAREYNKQYYYYRNKLRLFQYGIIFLVMLLESFLTYIIIKNAVNIHANSDVPLYVCSILLSLAFPLFAGITYLIEPYKRKRIDFNFKNSMLFRIVIMIQLIVIIYAFNVYLGMPIGFSSDYALSTTLPMILTTNIPLCGIIHRILYKSKIFAVEN